MLASSGVLALVFCGAIAAAAYTWIVVGPLTLGSPRFLIAAGVSAVAYGGALWAVRRAAPGRAALVVFALITIAMRAPTALAPVGRGSDIMRYVWDARVQRAGLSPYRVIPSDPANAHLHTAETRQMNNVNITSPYPPGAQLFFRLATLFSESARAIKLALVLCDLAVAALLVVWLRSSGRNPLLAIAYAWNPLVVLEVAHSGHLDAAGMLAVAVAGFALSRRRIAISIAALAAGIAIKFLPIVLVPLWWRRARLRHALLGVGILAALYLMFIDPRGETMPVGSVTNMIRGFRFNGPVFKAIAFLTSPWMAAAAGVGAGLLTALLIRRRQEGAALEGREDPAAFAWPMAAALVCAPVVYPWYLLWLTPFFISALTWPLALWSVMILGTYTVWHRLPDGGAWAVPIWMGLVEYAALFAATALVCRATSRGNTPPGSSAVRR